MVCFRESGTPKCRFPRRPASLLKNPSCPFPSLAGTSKRPRIGVFDSIRGHRSVQHQLFQQADTLSAVREWKQPAPHSPGLLRPNAVYQYQPLRCRLLLDDPTVLVGKVYVLPTEGESLDLDAG